ncbi:uncharacterized protein LOC112555954 [Pomacea canaliculata]|uniref:uncharacterized protein LOC112555954 n=1 Tax=Pomacea canaliculata TaxID=400727 RepID=UPI000D73A2F8|nr:uncharacterized protein LOC112555954 [Pomacea canaliculata]
MVDGSRSPDAGRVREHLNDEENTNILLASQQEHYKIKPDISSVGDIVQILNNEQPAEKMFTGSDTSLDRSDTLEQLINLPEKIFKNTFAVLEDEEQKPNTSNIFPVWSFQGYLDDKFRSREESEKNVDQTVFDRLNALLEGKLISQMFGQEESRSSAESQQNRLRHRHPRSVPSHSMPQDDKIVVYVPLGLPVGQKLLDPTHAMKEAHTDTTVYSVVPDLSVVKVNERGELFLNGTGDVGAVYDFVIRAVQGTGSEPETRHEQQVLLHFQDNDDVVVRYDNEAQVYRRPGAYVMRVKVLTVIQDRCIEIVEPAMRDLFLAEPDGTVLVRANEEQLDKDFYHFHLLIKNRVDETILAKLPIVVYFLDEEASVDIKLEVVAKSQRFLLVGLLILMSIVIVAIAGALLFKRLKLGKESNRYSTAYGGAVDSIKSSNINDRGTASTGTNSKTLQADVATTERKNSSKPFIDDEHCYEEVNSPDKKMLIV